MLKRFHIDTETVLYGVIGRPVSHSLSPVMHNRAFAEVGLNSIYLAFDVTDISSALAGIRGLGLKGASITIPHKVTALSFLDEIDGKAQQIGAINTIVNHQGNLRGYNSDCYGAVKALTAKTTLWEKKVALIGAGGAARAVGFGLLWEGARITVFNRSIKKGENLAKDMGVNFRPLAEFDQDSHQIIVNTTSVGMAPNTQAIPITPSLLAKEMVVMDIVYNPLRTALLRAAKKAGCITVDGVDMFVYQGVAQFEKWTGIKAPVKVMRKAVLEVLQ
ncbi:shikimate dehydrogenase [Desulfococcaceae bacterium HSG7]|nr:shikimate dehydrogenase [Desulfococcaceae bacterium HSG7]